MPGNPRCSTAISSPLIVASTGPPTLLLPVPDDSTDSNYELIIGLGVGIPLFFILAIVVAVLVYMYVKRRAQKDAETQASSSSRSQGRWVTRGRTAGMRNIIRLTHFLNILRSNHTKNAHMFGRITHFL